MRNSRTLFAAAALGAVLLGGIASADPTGDAVMAAILKNPIKGARVGVNVRRMSDGKEIASHNGNTLLELASNTKILTTSAALWKLGLDYQFKTKVLADGPIVEGVLQGNLIVVSGGDPNFSGRFYNNPMHVPRQMATAIAQSGITKIAGDIVLDDRFFDRQMRAPGWPAEDLIWWYAAPVSAISFNDNCVEVAVSGASGPGAAPAIRFNPNLDFMPIRNKATTIAKGGAGAIIFRREEGALVVEGRIAANARRTDDVTVPNPPLYFAAALRAALADSGITVTGADRLVADGEQPVAGAQTLLEWRSKLVDAVAVANRRSQNFYAEQILKTLGAETYGLGSFENGAKAVLEFTTAAHLPAGTVRIVDGCGLSAGNQATPQAVAALLEVIYRTSMKDVFIESLAVNGDADTTLRGRLKESAYAGRIHAKTGTIKSAGVSALSGYAMAQNGEVYSFSILSNGFNPGNLGAARNLEDAICRVLITAGGGPR